MSVVVPPPFVKITSETPTTEYWRFFNALKSSIDALEATPASGSGVALTFTSDTGSTADSDPGNGLFKWNNATQGSATVLYFDNQTADAISLTTFYASLGSGGFIYLQQSDDATKWQLWKWTATPTDGTGYRKFTTTLQASGGSIADAKTTYAQFFPTSSGTSVIDAYESTGSHTWTKRTGLIGAYVMGLAAGGGGGGGMRRAAGGAYASGGGGGGAFVARWFDAADLGSTESVSVGTGGAGGAGGTVNDAQGTFGSAGGNTTFGSHLTAYGGGGGAGADDSGGGGGGGGGLLGAGASPSAATVTPGGAGGTLGGSGGGAAAGSSTAGSDNTTPVGGAGGGGGDFNATGGAGGSAIAGGAGGGAGGGYTAAPVHFAGGAGGSAGQLAGGGGGATGAAGSAGTAGTAPTHIGQPGSGGGGGGSSSGANKGGNGGAGARGSGGGGGGSTFSSAGGGDGGRGGDGACWVINIF